MKNYLTLSEKVYSHVENIDKALLQTEVHLDYIGQDGRAGDRMWRKYPFNFGKSCV